jgi:transposase
VLAIDSTGLKVSERGEWIRNRYHLRRGFVKAHIAVDVSTATVVAVIVTDERKGDAGFLRPLVDEASRIVPGRIAKVIADGGYDTRENFDFLRSKGIEIVIRMRNNANMKRQGGSSARPLAVKERNEIGEKAWRKKHSYGQRWIVEGAFSAVKRIMGEALRSRRSDLMLREAQHKFVQYGRLLMA